MKNRPFFLLSILAMLALLLIGKSMNSKVEDAKVVTPECYRTPIMALEFSEDAAMIYTIFKLPEPDSLIRVSKTKPFVSATNLDYLYILGRQSIERSRMTYSKFLPNDVAVTR